MALHSFSAGWSKRVEQTSRMWRERERSRKGRREQKKSIVPAFLASFSRVSLPERWANQEPGMPWRRECDVDSFSFGRAGTQRHDDWAGLRRMCDLQKPSLGAAFQEEMHLLTVEKSRSEGRKTARGGWLAATNVLTCRFLFATVNGQLRRLEEEKKMLIMPHVCYIHRPPAPEIRHRTSLMAGCRTSSSTGAPTG